MNVENLKRMILILEEVIRADGGFDLDDWGSGSAACGTSCCAMGYAALDPVFQQQGLRMHLDMPDGKTKTPKTVRQFNHIVSEMRSRFSAHAFVSLPDHTQGFDAARRLFGISISDAEWLFSPQHYEPSDLQNPRAVIARIKTLIRDDANRAKL